MIYHAITVKDGLITARHESSVALSKEFFENGNYAGNEFISVSADSEYKGGYRFDEYNSEGKLRPLEDRVRDGLRPCPQGWQLVDGKLVKNSEPVEKTDETLQETIDKIRRNLNLLGQELVNNV